MLKRRFMQVMLGLLVCLSIALPFPKPTHAASAEDQGVVPGRVLLLYDSLAIGTPKEGNIEALERLLAALGAQVTAIAYDRYTEGTLQSFDKLISVRNADDLLQLPASFLRDLAGYSGNLMEIGNQTSPVLAQQLQLETQATSGTDTIDLNIGQLAQSSISVNGIAYMIKYTGTAYGTITSERRQSSSPYGVVQGKFAYIPYLVKGNLTELASSFVLKDWLQITAPSHYYVLLNDIYPFSDLDLLNETADRLYEAGIPFIASVQPVLDHLDYPAALRYLETLKHLQSRNGSIVVNAPVVASTIVQDITVLKSQMTAFLDALAGYGIAPLGVGADMYWMYDSHYTENGLSFFDSGIVFANKRVMYRSPTDTSKAFASNVYTVQAGELSPYVPLRQALEPLPMDTAVVYPFPQDRKEMEATLTALTSDWTAFADYKNGAHTVRTDKTEAASRGGRVLINGQAILLNNNIQEIQSEHTYVQEGPKSLTGLFTVQNNIFIVLILVTLLMFAAFLVIGYRLYKQKYKHTGRAL